MPRTPFPLSLEFILLGFVHQQPMHGYEIYKKLASLQGAAMVWHIKQPRMYALLDRLEAEGLLSARLIPGETRPDRREYSITPTGSERFEQWCVTPVDHPRDMRQEFMAKLFFSRQAKKNISGELIASQIEVCNGWIAAIEAQTAALDNQEGFERAVLDYRLAQARSTLQWLEQCRNRFGGRA